MNDQLPIPGLVIPANTLMTPGGARGVRGLTGKRGLRGEPGPEGPIGNFNLTFAPFTVPEPGSRVAVLMQDASWASPGQLVYVEWSGTAKESAIFRITAVKGNTLTLLNPLANLLGPPTAQPFRYLTQETTLSVADNGWYLFCGGEEAWTLHLPDPELTLSYFVCNNNSTRSATITLEPLSGQIDEEPLLLLYPGQACRLFTNGSGWRSWGKRLLPVIIPEPTDPAFDLLTEKLWPSRPCLLVRYRGSDQRTLISGDSWLGFIRGADPDNPEQEARIGTNGNVLELSNNPGPIRLAQPTTINGGLTVPAGGANITGGLTIPSGGFSVSAVGANITGPLTVNSQGNWATFNSIGADGITTNAFDDRPFGGQSIYKEMLHCDCAGWVCTVRCWHWTNQWISWSFLMNYPGAAEAYHFRWDAVLLRGSDWASAEWVASDARNKRDIGPCEADALEILRKIPIQAYTHIKDGIRRAVGWVAQSVEKVLPDWVQEIKVPGPDGKTTETAKRVEPNDQGLPYLIRAIQQLDARLQKIDERITKLESRA